MLRPAPEGKAERKWEEITEIAIAKMLKFGVKLWMTLAVCGRAGSPRGHVESREIR
jgi:hypothetical protein